MKSMCVWVGVVMLCAGCSESKPDSVLEVLEKEDSAEALGVVVESLGGACSYHLYVDSCDGPEHLVMYCGPGLKLSNVSGTELVLASLSGELSRPDDVQACATGIEVDPNVDGEGFYSYETPIPIPDLQTVEISFDIGYETEEHLDACKASPYSDELVLTVTMEFLLGSKEVTVVTALDVGTNVWEDYDACVLDEDWREDR